MKKLFSFFLLLNMLISYSQSFVCGEDQQELLNRFNVQFLAANNLQNVTDDPSVKHVFNVRYHVVYNDDGITRTNAYGTPGLSIGFNEVMNSIKYLNINFNQFNIFFKYYGFDQINNTDYLALETNEEFNELVHGETAVPDAINIYIVNGGVLGAAARVYAFDDDFFIEEWTVCHEMGHLFSLVHPNFVQGSDCNNQEHAERNSAGATFNAASKGDQVVDTHAYAHDSYFNACDYLGGAVDCLGLVIEADATYEGVMVYPSINNFMYADPTVCAGVFTPGQGKRMREAIIGFWATAFDPWRNTVESLYEPFEIISTTETGAVLSVTDQPGEGGAIVCRQQQYLLRFQSGFTYIFTNTNPSPIFVDVNTQFNYTILPDTWISERIAQISPSFLEVGCIQNKVDRICQFELYKSGRLYSTQILGSMNITIEYLDEVRVKDPDLYNSLMEQYYYILKKETESGAIKEEVFYKP
jgi:hypothetical protein